MSAQSCLPGAGLPYCPGYGPVCPQLPSAGMSSKRSIMCIFCCLALERPLLRRCLAAMHRMWSSKTNLAERSGVGRTCWEDAGLCMVIWRDRLSSLSPVTSTSWKQTNSFIQTGDPVGNHPQKYQNIQVHVPCGAMLKVLSLLEWILNTRGQAPQTSQYSMTDITIVFSIIFFRQP